MRPPTADPGRPASLVITDGGLGGLLAGWTEGVCAPVAAGGQGPAGPALWFPLAAAMAVGEATAGARLAAARRQAELCHASELIVSEAHAGPDLPDPAVLDPGGVLHTHLLLAAAAEAARRGIPRVIWPVHLGGAADREAVDLHAVADACDRALLVGQLLQLDLRGSGAGSGGGGGAELRLDTPYVDFTDLQMAELALDLDVPRPVAMGASWCEGADGSAPGGVCRACGPCRRWEAAFLAAGGEAWLDAASPAVTIGALGGAAAGGTPLGGVSP